MTIMLSKKQKSTSIYEFTPEYSVILGCPRSGTTFLIDSLEAIPNSECISGHIFPLFLSHFINVDTSPSTHEAISNCFEFSMQDYLEVIQHHRFRQLQKYFRGNISFNELYQAFNRRRSINCVLYKEPFLAFSPEFTFHALPDCKIIHIYRDGRDCADSLERKYKVLTDEKLRFLQTAEMPLGRKADHRYIPWWVEAGREEEFLSYSPFLRSIWMWSVMVNRCSSFFSDLPDSSKKRILQVKYEDLVSNPTEYAKLISDFLGQRLTYRLKNNFQQASTKSIGIHKKRDRQEIETANHIAGKELNYFGYL